MSEKFDFFQQVHNSISKQAQSRREQLQEMSAPILDVFEKLKNPSYFTCGRYHFAFTHTIDDRKATFEFGLVDPADRYNCKHLGYGFIRICPNFREPYTLDIRKWDRVRAYATSDELLEALAMEYGALARQYAAEAETGRALSGATFPHAPPG